MRRPTPEPLLLPSADVRFHAGGIATIADREGPPQIRTETGLYERFMDRIYLPVSTEQLTTAQITVVNRLRRRLIEEDAIEPADRKVKEKFGRLIERLGVRSVFEWGCGYYPLIPYLPSAAGRYLGIDIDPEVVRERRLAGSQAQLALEFDAASVEPFEIGVAIFVFHFRVTEQQLTAIRHLIGPNGAFVANVYRRSEPSRRALARDVHEAGLQVTRLLDRQEICRNHEYWILHRKGAALAERVELALR